MNRNRHGGGALIALVISIIVFGAGEARAWDPVRDLTGKNLSNLVEDRVENFGRAVNDFAHDPVGYTLQLPRSVLNDICSIPAQRYEGILRGNAHGNWQGLPQQLINAIQPFYGVDLTRVRFATVSGLPNGYAMTFGNKIYFPEFLDLRTRHDLWWMAHELEHVVQYSRSRSDAQELCEYTAKSFGSGFQHDRIDMERAADRKANFVEQIAYVAMNGGVTYGARTAGRGPAPTAPIGPGDQLPPPPQIFSGTDSNSIWIANETDRMVYFDLQSRTFPWGSVALPPRSAQIFWGSPVDRDFQIRITTDGQTVMYVLPAQTKQHVSWNQFGILDVFYE